MTLHNITWLWHNTTWYCKILLDYDMTRHDTVPMTGEYGKCTSNCGLCNEPKEKVSYCFYNRFIWQTFVHGVNFPNACLVTVITFPWLTYLATWCTKWYCLSTQKSFLCLSSINKPRQNDKKFDKISKQRTVLPLTVNVQRTSAQYLYKCTIPMMWQAPTRD